MHARAAKVKQKSAPGFVCADLAPHGREGHAAQEAIESCSCRERKRGLRWLVRSAQRDAKQ